MTDDEKTLRDELKESLTEDVRNTLIQKFKKKIISEHTNTIDEDEKKHLSAQDMFVHSSQALKRLLSFVQKKSLNGPIATAALMKASYIIGQTEPLQNKDTIPKIELPFGVIPDNNPIIKAQNQLLDRYRDLLEQHEDHQSFNTKRRHLMSHDTLLAFIQDTRSSSLTLDQRAEHIGIIKTHLIFMGYTQQDTENRIQNPLMNRAYTLSGIRKTH